MLGWKKHKWESRLLAQYCAKVSVLSLARKKLRCYDVMSFINAHNVCKAAQPKYRILF